MTKHLLCLAVLFSSLPTQAKVLFEGYYKIEVKGVHRGYVVQRHSVDDKTGQRNFSYYIYRKENGSVSQLGVKTESAENYKPLNYTYWEWLNADSTVTEGKFGPKNLELTKYDGRSRKVIETFDPKPIPAITVFSSLITQIQAKSSPNDYKDGLHVAFSGFSEETGQFDKGDLKILRSTPVAAQMIYQVIGNFMNEPYEVFTFRNGEILGSRSTILDTITYLVATREEAVGDFELKKDSITKVFGNIPFGATNNPVGQASGKLDARDVIRNFALPTAKERSPANAPTPMQLPK